MLKVEHAASGKPVSFLLCFSDMGSGKSGESYSMEGKSIAFIDDTTVLVIKISPILASLKPAQVREGEMDYVYCFINH